MSIIEAVVLIIAILCTTLTIICYLFRDKFKGDD